MNSILVDHEKKYRIGLSFFEGIGPLRFEALMQYFGSAEKIYAASKQDLLETNIGNALVDKFTTFREEFDLNAFVADFERRGIRAISKTEPTYPQQMLDHKDAPFMLYVIGDIRLLNNHRLFGVVGTRQPTRYGISLTRTLSMDLVRAGFTIVSGMAMGIDAVSHQAALDEGGSTIAVLGCGVDICYPAVNRGLYEQIMQQGLIVSEFPPGKRTARGVFPSRNRIIAGLSRGILVTEGAKKSGSLITARYASDYGRDVFAIPGPVTSGMSGATTWLLQNGAKAVGRAEDILDEYTDMDRTNRTDRTDLNKLINGLSEDERTVVTIIQKQGAVHIDVLARYMSLPVSGTLSIISKLEMRGILVEVENEEYALG